MDKMNFESSFGDLVERVKKVPDREMGENEILSDDGSKILCTVCHETKRVRHDSKLFGVYWTKPETGGCKCEREKAEAEKQQNIKDDFMRFWNGEKYLSLMGKRYATKDFSKLVEQKDNPSYQTAKKACMDYVKSYDICLDRGYGIYLYSAQAGNGKSSLLACVRNALIEKLVPTVYINYSDLVSLASDRGNENASTVLSFNGLMSVKVLIIDDIGAEDLRRNTNRGSWINGFLYELIDTRYNNCLCTMFSSNYTVEQLQNLRGYDFKVCDRITGASTKTYKITGKSFRGETWELSE